MSFELGGYANKLGNQYESLWIVKQYLKLLDEEIKSVTVEAIGPDEEGVDLIIEKHSGDRIFQQCKARNASFEYWRTCDLNSRGIFANCKNHLDRGPNNQFCLVSGVPAKSLGDICTSAKYSNDSSEDFYNYQIVEYGKTRNDTFQDFCKSFNLNSTAEPDRAQAFNYLKRLEFISWDFDSEHIGAIHTQCKLFITGDSQKIISELRKYAEDNIRKTVTAPMLKKHLEDNSFYPRFLEHDARVLPAIKRLQAKFIDSIKSDLVNGMLIQRQETTDLIDKFKDYQLVVLHGDAGKGKSGVLYEYLLYLNEANIPCLPVRLDRQKIGDNLTECHKKLELPSTPALCLKSILSNNQRGIIIIDQLDALRWTTGHSTTALEVCKDIVREARILNLLGTNIGVVIACRTFDLENDPLIKSWLGGEKEKNILEVNDLYTKINEILTKLEILPEILNTKQKKIISSPLMLKMWLDIHKSGNTSRFETASALMRQFFEYKFTEIEKQGVSGQDINIGLNKVVEYMDCNGQFEAPASLLNDNKLLTELQTSCILRKAGNQLIFCHQSYLDFLIAVNLLNKVLASQLSIADWLQYPGRQNLLSRERLKLALALLADQDTKQFDNQCIKILESSNVRFHLKQLTLQVIGYSAHPSEQVIAYLTDLCQNDYWLEHIFSSVFIQNVEFANWLDDNGYITKWFNDSIKKKYILWILRIFAVKLSSTISKIFKPIIKNGATLGKDLLSVLDWHIENDTDELFELRLKLLEEYAISGYISWGDLASKHPQRLIDYLHAYESSLADDNTELQSDSRIYSKDIKAFRKVGIKCSMYAWQKLIPSISRKAEFESNHYSLSRKRGTEKISIKHSIMEILIFAGRQIAQDNPMEFWNSIKKLSECNSYIVKGIIIKSLPKLCKDYSDNALNWLMSDPNHMQMELNDGKKRWTPIAQVIKKLSPYSSEEVFIDFENYLYSFFAPQEKKDWENSLDVWKVGFFNYYWGRAQYFFLPALPTQRCSPKTRDLIQLLTRKFGKYDFDGYSHTGGRVTSTVYRRTHLLSDRNWLKIINNEKLNNGHRLKIGKQYNEDTVLKSSIEAFSSTLRTVAEENPERFGNLALYFKKDVDPRYLSAIVSSFDKTSPASNIQEDKKVNWQACPIRIIEEFFSKHDPLQNPNLGNVRDMAINFCWMVEHRAEDKWSEKSVDILLYYALNHKDPEENKLNLHSDKTADQLYENTLNCVRGVAVRAMGQLLWSHENLYEKLVPVIKKLIDDPHPVVRMAVLGVVLPVMNIDRQQAIYWFVKLCKSDLRITTTEKAMRVFNSAAEEYYSEFKSIVIEMLNSEVSEIAEHGAGEIIARNFFYGHYQELFNNVLKGNSSHRQGAAEVIAYLFKQKNDYREKCENILIPLLNDSDEKVRNKAAEVFDGLDLTPEGESFILSFVHSKAFENHSGRLTYLFEDYGGNLIPFVSIICELSDSLINSYIHASEANRHLYEIEKLAKILLRVYEQAESQRNDIAINECLNIWDRLLENNIYIGRELTELIER